jgi:hypothetical protein
VAVRPETQEITTMGRVTGLVMVGLAVCWLGMSSSSADPSLQEDDPQPLVIADLQPMLDGEEVTIKFTITELVGIAQRAKEGQAPSFAIETAMGNQKNKLSVWIEGELANVLDRLQMSAFQENALKPETVVIARGKLTVHQSIVNHYFLHVDKWQGFRILPAKPDK